MQTKKHYQYLYLLEKIKVREEKLGYNMLNMDYWDNMGTGLCSESIDRWEAEDQLEQNRINHLKEWLNKGVGKKSLYNEEKLPSK